MMKNDTFKFDDSKLDQIRKSRAVRKKLAENSLMSLMHLYFPQYITYQSAPFHLEIYDLLEDDSVRHLMLMAFRGSGKSTIVTLGYPIWSILGKNQKKFVLIASQTQPQAQQHLKNIKREFEGNELLRKDYGPLNEESDEWGSVSLVLPRYNARISAVSVEQSIRGVRHGAHRPDLIICDDVEDSNSVKTREGRNKVFDWYTGEVVPAGDLETKRIVIGNLLHEDSLLMRLKERIQSNEIDGIFRDYPLVRDRKQILWKNKFPDKQAIRELKRTVGNKVAWEREYMLRIIPDEDQIIDPQWIQFYDELPAKTKDNEYVSSFVSVDLAISQKATADKTAIVIIHVYGHEQEDRKYYIDRRFINKRLSHLQTLESIVSIHKSLPSIEGREPRTLVEQVAYQAAVVEQLNDKEIKAIGVKIYGDKRARLQLASYMFEQGKVFFPKDKAAQPMIQQLIGFGVEKHDDLADAISMGLNYIQAKVKWEFLCAFSFAGEEVYESFGIKYLD